MSIAEWYNSDPMKQVRLNMFNNTRNSICQNCYNEEDVGGNSRRQKSNIKSVIFVKDNFVDSYQQSPGFDKFEYSKENSGNYFDMPIDLHIDLGNFCNLACKMCWAGASNKIAAQEVRWGITESSRYLQSDWTKDQAVWDRVLDEIASIPKLKNVHFMGGETLITKRFEDFVDFMISKSRFDLSFSFVTNGTVFNESLIKKLARFNRVGIEVSIETVTPHNQYQRQGTDTDLVLKNINRYLLHCGDSSSISVTARPAISLLTIGNYDSLLKFCFDNNIMVKSLLVTRPRHFDVTILPTHIKDQYKKKYLDLKNSLNLNNINESSEINYSDPNMVRYQINSQIDVCLRLLDTESPADSDEQLNLMVKKCRQWDQLYDYDARTLYPEMIDIFNQYDY
jgi:MoaA/NifB/PqqE/SkfB family radical SAM enzyme